MSEQQNHWNKIYSSNNTRFSWSQGVPQTSLDFIHEAKLDKSANIIDVGGGDSRLVDFLIKAGCENISVLDISEQALARTKQRLGNKADKVNWIVSDFTDFHPDISYDLWHDRASFHFLTSEHQISKYISALRQGVKENGVVIIGTFSSEGPEKCSGLDIKRYSEENLTSLLGNDFVKIKCLTEDHITPNNIKQNFLFCSFRRIK